MATILVLDDTPAMRNMLEDTLVRAGHTVTLANDGRSGLRLLDAGTFDLLVTDLVMPDVDGLEVLRNVRRRTTKPVVIAMSAGGRGSPKDYLELASLFGAAATLEKPFTRAALLEAIARVLPSAKVLVPPAA